MRKRITALLLSAVLCLTLLTSCADVSGAGSNENGTSAAAFSPDTSFTGSFSCVANGVPMGERISVTVCEEYRDRLGTIVNVASPSLKDSGYYAGDELRVYVSSVEATNPVTVSASEIVLLLAGPNHTGNNFGAGYGYGPYIIATAEDVEIPDDFPDFTDPSLKLIKRDYGVFDYGAFLVVRVEKSGDNSLVYLASIGRGKADIALYGKLTVDIGAGDYIHFNTDVHYNTEDNSMRDLVYMSDISELKILNDEEINTAYRGAFAIDKPVIYLYPEKPTECSVRVLLDGVLTCTYPEHGADGWKDFTAMPDGTLLFPDGGEYYCLYWEGRAALRPDFSEGFCVRGCDTAAFLRGILPQIGLNAREANEFIIYWLPLLCGNEYNIISFQSEAYTDIAGLEINPAPDSLLRVYMAVYASDAPVTIEPQDFSVFERRGFTVVEWGGSIIK